MANTCALARQRLAQAVADLRAATTREKAVSAVKAGFLGSINTPLRMMGGNAVSLAFRSLVQHPAETAVDYVRAVAQSAAKGKLSFTPSDYRSVRLALDSEGLKRYAKAFWTGTEPTRGALRTAHDVYAETAGPWKAVREAVIAFSDDLNTRLDAEHIYRTTDYQDNTHYNNPLSNAAVNGVFGIAEALDRPYWRAAHDFSLWMQSKVLAGAEGLKGAELKARAAEIFEHPTDEMAMRAADHANYTTFKNKTPLGNAAQDVKTGLARRADKEIPTDVQGYERTRAEIAKAANGIASFMVELNLPFTGVPSSVAGQSFAIGTGPLSLVRLLSAANRNPAMAARIIAESGTGTAIMALGYHMAQDGALTGPAPTSPSDRAQFDAEGKQAYSVRVGDKQFDIRFAMPVAAPLLAGAALYWSKGETPSARATAGVGSTAKMLTAQTYLQNLNNTIEALQDPVKRGERFVVSQIPMPALLGQVARASDPLERDPKSIPEMLAVKIPGLSRTVNPRVDALGRVQERTLLERASEVISPSRIKETSETPVTREFRRLGISLNKPSPTVTFRGEKMRRTPGAQVTYEQSVGPIMAAELGKLMASPQYQRMDDEIKAKALLRVRDRIHEVYGKRDAMKTIKAGE